MAIAGSPTAGVISLQMTLNARNPTVDPSGLGAVRDILNILLGQNGKYNIGGFPVTSGHTASAALDFGPITGAPQMVIVVNLDDTNILDLANDSSITAAKVISHVPPLGIAIFTPDTGTVYHKAQTADIDFKYWAFEA